jgi:hypothetical protein
LRKILAVDELHDQRVSAFTLFEPVNLRDVWIIERRECPRFALEACETFGIVRERVGEHLQRHVASELRIARVIHLPHAAGADLGSDLIWAEAGSGAEGHDRVAGL